MVDASGIQGLLRETRCNRRCLITCVVMMLGLLSGGGGCVQHRLEFDKDGIPHGTGWKYYRYKSGELMLKEYYRRGDLVHSEWFQPDGTLIRKEDWHKGSGIGIYLREDGSIRAAVSYENGVAHGLAVFLKEDGLLDKIVEYDKGKEIWCYQPAETAPDNRASPE